MRASPHTRVSCEETPYSARTTTSMDMSKRPARMSTIAHRWRVVAFLVLAALTLLAAAWMYWPQASLPTMASLLEHADRWHDSPLAPAIALAAFVIGGLVVFPVNLLIAATIV